MDPFDKLAADIANASSPFALGRDWSDIQAGFAALMVWKKATEARISALEGSPHVVESGGRHPGPTGSGD